MQKWEYCRLRHYYKHEGGSFGHKETESVDFRIYNDSGRTKKYKADKLDSLISSLGNQGWELVSVAAISTPYERAQLCEWETMWYFKRSLD